MSRQTESRSRRLTGAARRPAATLFVPLFCLNGLRILAAAHGIEAMAEFLIARSHPDLQLEYYLLCSSNLVLALMFLAKAELRRRKSHLLKSGGLSARLRGEAGRLGLLWPVTLLLAALLSLAKAGAVTFLLALSRDPRYGLLLVGEATLSLLLVLRAYSLWFPRPRGPRGPRGPRTSRADRPHPTIPAPLAARADAAEEPKASPPTPVYFEVY